MVKSVKLDAVMRGVSPVFPENSLRSGFWTTLLGICPEDPVIDIATSQSRQPLWKGEFTFYQPIGNEKIIEVSTALLHCTLLQFYRSIFLCIVNTRMSLFLILQKYCDN